MSCFCFSRNKSDSGPEDYVDIDHDTDSFIKSKAVEVASPTASDAMGGSSRVEMTAAELLTSAEGNAPRSSLAFSHQLKGLVNPALAVDAATNQNTAMAGVTNNNYGDSIQNGSFIFLNPILDSSEQAFSASLVLKGPAPSSASMRMRHVLFDEDQVESSSPGSSKSGKKHKELGFDDAAEVSLQGLLGATADTFLSGGNRRNMDNVVSLDDLHIGLGAAAVEYCPAIFKPKDLGSARLRPAFKARSQSKERELAGSWDISVAIKEAQVLKQIGHGAYGRVYQASWQGQEVAIKVIEQESSRRPGLLGLMNLTAAENTTKVMGEEARKNDKNPGAPPTNQLHNSPHILEGLVSLSAHHPNIVHTFKVVTQRPGRSNHAALLSSLTHSLLWDYTPPQSSMNATSHAASALHTTMPRAQEPLIGGRNNGDLNRPAVAHTCSNMSSRLSNTSFQDKSQPPLVQGRKSSEFSGKLGSDFNQSPWRDINSAISSSSSREMTSLASVQPRPAPTGLSIIQKALDMVTDNNWDEDSRLAQNHTLAPINPNAALSAIQDNTTGEVARSLCPSGALLPDIYMIAENEVVNFGSEGNSAANNVIHYSAPLSSLMRTENLSGDLAVLHHHDEEPPATSSPANKILASAQSSRPEGGLEDGLGSWSQMDLRKPEGSSPHSKLQLLPPSMNLSGFTAPRSAELAACLPTDMPTVGGSQFPHALLSSSGLHSIAGSTQDKLKHNTSSQWLHRTLLHQTKQTYMDDSGLQCFMKSMMSTIQHGPEEATGQDYADAVVITYIVQEFCSGGTLRAALTSGTFHTRADSPSQQASLQTIHIQSIVQTALDVAKALVYLHSKNVVHGDLKADNVLLQSCSSARGFVAKLSDFGLSRLMVQSDDGLIVSRIGTASHMPPESIQDNLVVFASDSYSFGVLMWELYCVEKPFALYTPFQLITAVVANGERPTFPSHCPPSYVALAQQCMNAEHSKRPIMTDVAMQLEDLVRNLPVKLVAPSCVADVDEAQRLMKIMSTQALSTMEW